MRNPLTNYLLASVLMAAASDGGGQAAEARKKAEEARARQEAADREAGEKAKAAIGQDKPESGKPEAGKADPDAPKTDPATLDPVAQAARIDALERLIATMTSGMQGAQGPAPSELKDTMQVGPGAGFDPTTARPVVGGITSGPPGGQPMPVSATAAAGPTAGDGLLFWGRDGAGNPIRARRYPQLRDEDVIVTRTGYYDDTIRNAGETIKGYTGPAASWFVPKAIYDNRRARAEWDSLFTGREVFRDAEEDFSERDANRAA